jgi:hypothetical protein
MDNLLLIAKLSSLDNYKIMYAEIEQKLLEISVKNEHTKEYSLGDVLLLDKFEKILYSKGYSKEEIINLSPSYYNKKIF